MFFSHHFMWLIIRSNLDFFCTLFKAVNGTQSFLGHILSSKLSFRILFLLFSIMCTLCHRKDYDEQKAVILIVVSIITRVAN